jgi:hypothetical protein
MTQDTKPNIVFIKDKGASGTAIEDAEELAKYERFVRGTNGFLDFVGKATA